MSHLISLYITTYNILLQYGFHCVACYEVQPPPSLIPNTLASPCGIEFWFMHTSRVWEGGDLKLKMVTTLSQYQVKPHTIGNNTMCIVASLRTKPL